MKVKSKKLRFMAVGALLTAIVVMAAACGNNNQSEPNGQVQESNGAGGNSSESTVPSENEGTNDQLNVVTSFYPLYFLASEIGGEHVNAVNLVASGIEPHDWTPKSRDLSAITEASLFLYHGAGLEGWVDDVLNGLSKDNKVITKEMSEGITLIDGEGEQEHEHEQGDEEEHDHEGLDPHTWVSPKSAIILAENVKDSLIEADGEHKADYEQNYEALYEKLSEIDKAYTDQLSQASKKDIVVSHQAFGYLARDYGLHQVAIMGLSPEAEPRAQDLLDISKFVKENDVKVIFFEELVSDSLARTLADEAEVETSVLNPLEGLTPEQEKAGETYLTLMERNLQNLAQALQ